jgi:hypothetical protein
VKPGKPEKKIQKSNSNQPMNQQLKIQLEQYNMLGQKMLK